MGILNMNTEKTTEPQQLEKHRLLRFFVWLSRPTGLLELQIVLEQLRDVELMHLMSDQENQAAVTIAWTEFGRRHGTADIRFVMNTYNLLEVDIQNLTFGAVLGLG